MEYLNFMYVKNLLIIFIVVTLAACANTGPQSIGKDTYIVSARVAFSGQSGAKTEVLDTANEHCLQQDKKLLLSKLHSSECALHGGCGEAEITYLCLDENDPRFQSQHTEN